MSVVDADITALEVDAIVNSANTEMHLAGRSSVSGAIFKKAGERVLNELNEVDLPVRIGSVVRTSGVGLSCKHIFHMATHGPVEVEQQLAVEMGIDYDTLRLQAITQGITASIEAAKTHQCRSLALPLIGTGTLAFPAELSVEATLNTLRADLESEPGSIRQVIVVVKENPLRLSLVERALTGYDTETKNLQRELTSGLEKALKAVVASQALPFAGVALPAVPLVSKFIGGAMASTLAASVKKKASKQKPNKLEKPDDGAETKRTAVLEKKAEIEIANLKEQLRERDQTIATLKTMLVERGEEGEFEDDLPLPAAYGASMVRSEAVPALQVENLRRSLSILLRYLGALALAEYHAAGRFDAKLNDWLRTVFEKPLTDGTWRKVSSDVAHRFLDREPEVISELASCWHRDTRHWSPLNGRLDDLVKLRNQIHDAGPVDESGARAWLERALPIWRNVMELGRPLLRYRLFHLEQHVDVGEKDESATLYHVRWLSGAHFVQPVELVEWRARLRKDQLYVTDPGKERFLAMHDYMRYEHCEITKAREVCSLDRRAGESIHLATFRFPYSFSATPTDTLFD
ncbi:MAG: macro domain-containing protein [Polyangia bacterium]